MYNVLHSSLHAMHDEIACRAFPTTLSGNAKEWFHSLFPNSIGTFKDLAWIFLTHFLGSWERKKPFGYLLTFYRREGERLKEFMIRFNTKKLKVGDPTNGIIFFAIFNGITPEEPLPRSRWQEKLHEDSQATTKSYWIMWRSSSTKRRHWRQWSSLKNCPRNPGRRRKRIIRCPMIQSLLRRTLAITTSLLWMPTFLRFWWRLRRTQNIRNP